MNFSRDPQQQENKHRQEGDESPSAFQTSNMSAETVEIIIKKKRIKIKNLNLLILSGLLFIIIRLPPCGRDLPRFYVVNFPWCASPVVEGRVASRLRVKGLKQAEGGHVDRRPTLVKTMAGRKNYEHIHPKQLPETAKPTKPT